ncbi:thiamine phosphate synthase [Sphingopyxis sp.]|jgi:thiamine-phosphate pyrophosphorylase|uniref:thiamine phosphate synthase n=1 Tax=Sphingopyxis sp. TaxID=1908224 RepID=UPI003F6EF181
MVRRHPLPPQWLFSDERLAVGVVQLAALLPPGSGVVLRHDSLAPGARWRLLRRLMRVARARQLTVLIAGTPDIARCWGADGVHLRQHDARRAAQAHRLGLLVTMPVHGAREARSARRAKAEAVFISPLYPTRSHSGAKALGSAEWFRLGRLAAGQPIALGGMTLTRARALNRQASSQNPGWAAIDAWEQRAAQRLGRRAEKSRNPQIRLC